MESVFQLILKTINKREQGNYIFFYDTCLMRISNFLFIAISIFSLGCADLPKSNIQENQNLIKFDTSYKINSLDVESINCTIYSKKAGLDPEIELRQIIGSKGYSLDFGSDRIIYIYTDSSVQSFFESIKIVMDNPGKKLEYTIGLKKCAEKTYLNRSQTYLNRSKEDIIRSIEDVINNKSCYEFFLGSITSDGYGGVLLTYKDLYFDQAAVLTTKDNENVQMNKSDYEQMLLNYKLYKTKISK